MKQGFAFLLFVILSITSSYAQIKNEPYITWDDFVAYYLEAEDEGTNTLIDDEKKEWLEHIAHNPIQINRTGKEELLELPFLNERQVDSLLSYREKKHGFISRGELKLVWGMDYYTRAYLSLFVRCDSSYVSVKGQTKITNTSVLKELLLKGKHEVESRVDVPLYKRKGYEMPNTPTSTNYYVGNPLHHVVRYRYRYGKEAMYGLTLEKDAGEPVCKKGFYPYDYLSGYVWLRPKRKCWSIVVGDFQMYAANGLVYGKGGLSMRYANGNSTHYRTTFKPHTSTDETYFFRGIAFSYHTKRGWNVGSFVSYRRLDSRLNSTKDTAVTLQQTGLHRTLSEIDMRRSEGCFTSGCNVGLIKKHWGVELNECVNVYQLPISPKPSFYNAYYFRGKVANATSLSHFFQKKHFSESGEWAIDKGGNMAFVQQMVYKFKYRTLVGMNIRYLSPRFVSLYAQPLQQGSRASNEWGVMLNAQAVFFSKLEMRGYVDFFKFPKPTYNAVLPSSKGIDMNVQMCYSLSNAWNILLRYQLKSKQYTLQANEQALLQYHTTQKFRLASVWKQNKWEVSTQIDASIYTTQVGERKSGWMASVRSAYTPNAKFGIKCFVSAFFTDDYDVRLYAYQPQMFRMFSVSSFFYHGMNEVVLLNWNVKKKLLLSMRFSTVKYFNRTTISSRLDEICSSWKNDVSTQVRYVF